MQVPPVITLPDLPVEVISAILTLLPKRLQKRLRLVNKLFGEILRSAVLRVIVFDVHQGNLDLSLFEALAAGQNTEHPSGLCRLVKEVQVASLDPSFVRPKSDRNAADQPSPRSIDIVICEKRLIALLGQALYGLRKIDTLYWKAKDDQPLQITALVTRWITYHLANLKYLRISSDKAMSRRIFRSLHAPSLSTIRQITLGAPLSSGNLLQVRSILTRASSIETLQVGVTSLSVFNTLLDTPNDGVKLPLHRLHLNLSQSSVQGVIATGVFESLADLKYLTIEFKSPDGSRFRGDDCPVGLMWTTMKPHHWNQVGGLMINYPTKTLFKRLVDSFRGLSQLSLHIPGLNMRADPYLELCAQVFFDEVVPALAPRLRSLKISWDKNDGRKWILGNHSTQLYEKMIKNLGVLQSLNITVFSSKKGEDSQLQVSGQHLVNLLVQWATAHDHLRAITFTCVGFKLPPIWECPWKTPNEPVMLERMPTMICTMSDSSSVKFVPGVRANGTAFYSS